MKIATKTILFVLLTLMLISCNDEDKSVNKPSYALAKNWPDLPKSFVLGNPAGIGMDSAQHLFVFCRAGREWPLLGMPDDVIAAKTILMLDRNTGRLINSWGDHRFIMPHGLTVDAADNVWVTDVGLHQVFKFSHDGRLLLTLGEARVAGDDIAHFNQPTDVAIAKGGTFYVSDGYGNNRVMKFSADGKFLRQWGRKGSGPGEFNTPHGLEVDGRGNVYVADRENKRVQIFTAEGRFLRQWTSKNLGRISAVTLNKQNQQMMLVDEVTSWFNLHHKGSDVILMSDGGLPVTQFGRTGNYAGPKCWYHDLVTDHDGNIYTADILSNQLQKFRRLTVR